jgi:hypothetical protein
MRSQDGPWRSAAGFIFLRRRPRVPAGAAWLNLHGFANIGYADAKQRHNGGGSAHRIAGSLSPRSAGTVT